MTLMEHLINAVYFNTVLNCGTGSNSIFYYTYLDFIRENQLSTYSKDLMSANGFI